MSRSNLNIYSNNAQDFQFPDYYRFPPFFTIQPVLNTRKKQLQMWKDFILQYSRHTKIYQIDLNEPNILFSNDSINRKLSPESIRLVIEFLISEGNAEWKNKNKDSVVIYWRSPGDWASIIYKWVVDNALTDNVFTLFELREGEASEGEEFHKLDAGILISALKLLEKNKKAQIFRGNDVDSIGVKFFS